MDGGKPNVRGGCFDEEIHFTGELNVAKLTGWDPLEGKALGKSAGDDGLDPNLRERFNSLNSNPKARRTGHLRVRSKFRWMHSMRDVIPAGGE